MKITDPITAPTTEEEIQEFFEHIELVMSYIKIGTGTPEGNVTAPIGATFQRLDGGASTTFYVKESGTGNTGWVAK